MASTHKPHFTKYRHSLTRRFQNVVDEDLAAVAAVVFALGGGELGARQEALGRRGVVRPVGGAAVEYHRGKISSSPRHHQFITDVIHFHRRGIISESTKHLFLEDEVDVEEPLFFLLSFRPDKPPMRAGRGGSAQAIARRRRDRD